MVQQLVVAPVASYIWRVFGADALATGGAPPSHFLPL